MLASGGMFLVFGNTILLLIHLLSAVASGYASYGKNFHSNYQHIHPSTLSVTHVHGPLSVEVYPHNSEPLPSCASSESRLYSTYIVRDALPSVTHHFRSPPSPAELLSLVKNLNVSLLFLTSCLNLLKSGLHLMSLPTLPHLMRSSSNS
jgi:hypothetical protein